jgi:superoxide dismutase, Cu-Zn family
MLQGRPRILALAAAALALTFAGCSHSPKVNSSTGSLMSAMDAKIEPTQGNTCHGKVQFVLQDNGSVKVIADLDGLPPNAQHAIHIHEVGDCSAPDAMSAKGHFNPEAKPHGLPPADDRHAGDLGNLTADAKGHSHYEITVTNITLTGPKNPILGLAVIVHAKPDDGGQPTGNAGARLGCGVIATRKP